MVRSSAHADDDEHRDNNVECNRRHKKQERVLPFRIGDDKEKKGQVG